MKRLKCIFAALYAVLLLTGCAAAPQEPSTESSENSSAIQIGMSFDTFVLERWLRDRDVFVSTAQELGAEVNVQNANGDVSEQAAQIEYLIDKNVDVLVIIAIDGTDQALQKAIQRAQEKGIVVIAYDRTIQDTDVDLYISFDNEEVGRLMAEAVLNQIPENGKIAALYGSPSDYNVVLVKQGIQKVLDAHNRSLIYENHADNWRAEHAYDQMTECIEQVGAVDAVICGNDGLAAMAFKALSEHQMADDVCIVGQDADIDACQRIVEGTQYMTVYKSIDQLAKKAAQYAVKLAAGEDIALTETFPNGSYEVPYLGLPPVAVTKENMDEEIISSRFHLRDEVYLNVETED